MIKLKKKELAFGTNLKVLRKKNGYSRKQLADILAYSEKSIEKWEMTGAIPPVSVVSELAELFDVTVDSLIYSTEKEIKYFLGIDGGGTKTEFLLTEKTGNEISRIILGPSNPVDIGIENTFKVLEQGINEICKGISKNEVSVFVGLAGGTTGDSLSLINKFLKNSGFTCYANGSDTENALEIALGGDDGIAIIMGTGIIAFAQKNNIRHRIGGWGYLIDKGGSGYNFGVDALDSALKNIDGRGGSAIIRNLIESHLGNTLPDSVFEIYRKGKSYIASFATFVFEAFIQGDPEAAIIIERNIKEVAEIIKAGKKKLNLSYPKTVICGGLCHYKDILLPFFKNALGDGCEITFNDNRIVNGALKIAKRNAERMLKENA